MLACLAALFVARATDAQSLAPAEATSRLEGKPAVSGADSGKSSAPTALDRYVAAADPSFSWKVVDRRTDDAATELFVALTSQTWRTADEVDRPVWTHWLTIVIPKKVTSDVALLIIDGGDNEASPPKTANDLARKLALATATVAADLSAVPNQPLEFRHDGQHREEDGLLAYTWRQSLETGDLTWPGQLPMTKSAVRAMDAVQAAVAAEPSTQPVKRFVVAGASKRGWTTWLTAAVDSRVAAIAPIVIDTLNLQAALRHHHETYGFWAPALDDYKREGLLDRLDDPRTAKLVGIVDPFSYRDRYRMPKCIINASGDEFFVPDSSQFYFDALPGEKLLSYFPNSGHNLHGTNAIDTLTAFYWSIAHDSARPTVAWQTTADGSWDVTARPAPARALLWHATNPAKRDFRFDQIGAAYTSQEIQPIGEGHYLCGAAPAAGFTAFFVQLEFDIGAPTPLRVSTPVKVITGQGAAAETKSPPPAASRQTSRRTHRMPLHREPAKDRVSSPSG